MSATTTSKQSTGSSTSTSVSSVTTSTSPDETPTTRDSTPAAELNGKDSKHDNKRPERAPSEPSAPHKRSLSISHRATSAFTSPPEPPKIHEVPHRSPFGALLSRTLPHYTGAYSVGVCDLELPVARKTFGTFKHKKMPEASAGLAMDTVLFSLFYPCDPPEKPSPVAWFPKLGQTIDGFLKMAKRTPNFWYRMIAYPLAAAAIHGTTFPASKDAPLATPPHTMANGKWPLMIFSHGVGCSRLMYSAFCGEMASRGYVVAVLEHRDGTSPSSTIAAADGTTTTLDWIEWSDLYWPELEEQPPDDTILRHEQIKLRVAEVEATVDLMQRLSRGEPVTRDSIDSPDFDWERWKYMDASRPVMAGHSLGGSAALAASSTSDIDFRSVVVFDPAVQRLEPWKSPLPHPLLVINSSEFTLGREYAIFSTQITRTVTNSLLVLSIGGATHPSFSDVFLILPAAICRMTGLKASPAEVISKAVKATEEWLAGKRVGWDGVWQEGEDREEQAKEAKGRLGRMSRKGKEKYMPAGKPGELSWHPL